MTDKKKKKSLIHKIEDFLASYKGKVILNYAYSWGAAIVILGTLFKLVHIQGANTMLFIGMGTEVLVFFISAFDRPYKSYKWESVFPNLKISGSEFDKKKAQKEATDQPDDAMAAIMQAQAGGNVQAGGGAAPIIIGGGYSPAASGAVPAGTVSGGGGVPAGGQVVQGGMQGIVPPVINFGSGAPATPVVEVTSEMEEATKDYMEQLKGMTEALTRFSDLTKDMGQDAEQINILNKNLSGINAIYEIQLRNISTQLGTIDEINEQTRKMAKQIEELNQVYARMLEAMTVNMRLKNEEG